VQKLVGTQVQNLGMREEGLKETQVQELVMKVGEECLKGTERLARVQNLEWEK
jgi:hypothetical protein